LSGALAPASACKSTGLDAATVADLQAAFQADTLSSVTLVQMPLARIEAYDKKGRTWTIRTNTLIKTFGGSRRTDLNPVRGHEPAGARPVLVLSHDVFNERSGTVIAVALPVRSGAPTTP